MVGDQKFMLEAAYRHAEARHLKLKEEQDAPACSTCRWCSSRNPGFYAECQHPFVSEGKYDPITGETKWDYQYCRSARIMPCGKEGALHELPWTKAQRFQAWLGGILAL